MITASYFSFFDVMEKVGLIFGPLMFGLLEGIFGEYARICANAYDFLHSRVFPTPKNLYN